MSKISKKFNWLLVLSVSLSVLVSSLFTTSYLMIQMSRDSLEKDKMQVMGLSGVIENFLNHASTLNYQLSQNPEIIDLVENAPSDWNERQKLYNKSFNTESSFNLNTGLPSFVKNHNEYEFVELFFLQDIKGNQIARSFGPLGSRSERWWFKEFINKRNYHPFLSKSYYSMTGHIPVSSFFHPVYDNGMVTGILGMDINFHYIQELVEKQIYADDMYAVVLDSEGVIIAHPDSEMITQLTNIVTMTKQVLTDNGTLAVDGHHKTEEIPLEIDKRLSDGVKKALNGKSSALKRISWGGKVNNISIAPVEISGMYDRYAVLLVHDNSMMNRARNLIICFCLLAILLTITIIYNLFKTVFSKAIIKPLETIIEAMQDIDFEHYREIELVTNDEFDVLAGTYNSLRHKLRKANKQLKDQIKRLEDSRKGYRALAETGLALTNEKDKNLLLETILTKARTLTNSEGGTLYLYNQNEDCLDFAIIQNEVLNINENQYSDGISFLPPVPLHVKGVPNMANVSSYAALTSKIINIPDVYATDDFDFHGMKEYDANLHYRSKSMLVFPMKNLDGQLIGVIQLINARSENSEEVVSFISRKQNLVTALGSQAAAILTYIKLTDDLKSLFYSFQRSIATAIDEKSPFTAGHIKRVVALTELIAKSINQSTSGHYAEFHFTVEELEELKVAAWMHDIGKITTPEHIMNKSSRLSACHSELDVIRTRFKLAGLADFTETDSKRYPDQLTDDLEFIEYCNTAGFLTDEDIGRLNSLSDVRFFINGESEPLLNDWELKNLSIRKGTLNKEERNLMEYHVVMTQKILEQITFPSNLKNVCKYASLHHEKLNGSGYPVHMKANEIPLQARIIVFSDIIEALTAKDRPYRKHLPINKAISIIENMVLSGELDKNIYEIFMKGDLISDYFEIIEE